MQAGKLRHVIMIEQPTETLNGLGEPVVTWATFATLRASIEHREVGERFSDGRIFSERRTRFGCRWLSGVTTQMRVNYGGRLFDIKAVDPVLERRHELVLWTVERVV